MMESVKDFIPLISLVLSIVVVMSNSSSQFFELILTAYNPSLDDYILGTSSSMSVIVCALLCSKNPTCVSFLFDAPTCTMFSEVKTCPTGDIMENYFAIKDRQPKSSCGCTLANNASFVNVALGKPVNLSSYYAHEPFTTDLMVDGNRGFSMPCPHTDFQQNPYALIDLQQSYNMFAFFLVNRFDSDSSKRLHDLKILVGDDLNNLSVCADHPDIIGQNCTLWAESQCQGRFVKIQVFSREFFHICEFEAYSVL